MHLFVQLISLKIYMHPDKFNLYLGRYLINRYLGTFLDETISMDQLSVDGAIRDINHFIIPIMEYIISFLITTQSIS